MAFIPCKISGGGSGSSGVFEKGTFTASTKTFNLSGNFSHVIVCMSCSQSGTRTANVSGTSKTLTVLGSAHSVFGLSEADFEGSFTNPQIIITLPSSNTWGYTITAY